MDVTRNIQNSARLYHIREMIFTSRKKNLVKLFSYASIITIVIIIVSVIQFLNDENGRVFKSIIEYDTERYQTDLKYILIWKPSHEKTNSRIKDRTRSQDGQRLFIKQNCKYINCFITYDKNLLKNDHRKIDAVVFNVRDIQNISLQNINLTRSFDQKFIFHSMLSSEDYPVCNRFFDTFFNWTWTYRLDSDIPKPFINIFNSKGNLVGPRKGINWNSLSWSHDRPMTRKFRKTKAVAWIVTKCETRLKYQEFVNEMKKELMSYNYSIDIYGPCGDKPCPSGHLINCFKLVEKEYYFQMILEDAFVDDYISEMIAYAMSHVAVPIVIGTPSNYEKFLPPGSFINAQMFDMKKLGAIIDFLIQYPVTYKYFFDWKNHYYYTIRPRNYVCDLCAKLNKISPPKVYKNFRKWWNPGYKDVCHRRKLHNKF